MATDYVLFIHGVTVREPEPAMYANGLFASISKYVEQKKSHNKNGGKPSRTLKKVPLYWGNVGVPQEQALLAEYRSSPLWNRFWFRPLREGTFLRFTGDTALYLSRYIGGKVADKLKADAEQALGVVPLDSFQPDPEDRLHLVAHSLGAVILFDILFSARWGQAGEGIPGWDSVQAIRRAIYGVEPDWEKGICLGSISTLGSPLGIFSLLDVDKEDTEKTYQGKVVNTHDITPRLQQMLAHLRARLGEQREARLLPWRNFVHPGDPLGSPLDPLIPHLINGASTYIDLKDVITTAPLDWLFTPVKNGFPALIDTFRTHTGYWQSQLVAETIGQIILEAAESVQATSKALQPGEP